MGVARYLAEGDSIDYTPVAAVAAGDVLVIGTAVCVANEPIAIGRKGSLRCTGIHEFPKQAGVAMNAMTLAYWVVAGPYINATSAGNTLAGRVTEDAAAGATTVKVRLQP